VFWFGACAGGVWKTTDGGTYWRCVSDGFLRTAAVGAIAVAPSDPDVVYAGMGESCVRGDVSHGDGVYRTTDGGKSWIHLGLARTRHVARVRVHPSDPDVVWVAALGDIFGPSEDRGVYRTSDGGRSWECVLFGSPDAGAADLWLDPSNPRILYASLWEARRTPWSMSSGGRGSALHRSADGGRTWQDITRHRGLPKGIKGRIGVCASPARPSRVWALVEAKGDKGGLYRSDDHGDTWDRVSEHRGIQGRPWYYSHIVPDPQDADSLYSLNFEFWKSSDGGATFVAIPTPHGDNHDLWIDPADPQRMIEGNDGGACVSFDGAETFSTIYNQPTAQFYHLAIDRRFPYRVLGTQQDNSAVSVPSRTRKGCIPFRDCYDVGHSESGHIAVDPREPDVVYSGAVGSSPGGGGALLRYDHRTEQIQSVTVWPEPFYGEGPGSKRHRFAWTFPIVFSPHDAGVLYACGECVFRSANGGRSWEPISPDLTRADPSKLEASGGPITKDTSGAEHYCTVFAFAESPHEPGVLWAGTDDGLVHRSDDAGATWTAVTPPDLPEWTTVNTIEPSPHDRDTVYLSATRYKLADRTPYLFVTRDRGRVWRRITDGIPADDFARVVRADPVRAGLLYAGTETGVYVSFDDGAWWQRLSLNLPAVPVYDLAVVGSDLVVATHGRSFWVLDDVSPLREMPAQPGAVHLFAPPPTIRYWSYFGQEGAGKPEKTYAFFGGGAAFVERKLDDGRTLRHFLDAGECPPDGVPISYMLAQEAPHDAIRLAILDADGNEVASFTPEREEPEPEQDEGVAPEPSADSDEVEGAEAGPVPPRKRHWEILPRRAGFNRFWWHMGYEGVRTVPDEKGHSRIEPGPLALPGRYSAKLIVGDAEVSVPFEIVPEPRLTTTAVELHEQFALAIRIRDRSNAVNEAVTRMKKIKPQLEAWTKRPDAGEIAEIAKRATKALSAVEERLTQPKIKHDADRLKLPMGLDAKLREIAFVVQGADAAPTVQAREMLDDIDAQASAALDDFGRVIAEEIAELNRAIDASDAGAIDVTAPPPS
jgi:photosystem II stability/assembly factor-like uncharacterized protein